MASKWIAYNELAWTVDWLAEPKEYEDEVMVYVNLIRQTAKEPPGTLLHLGSGAGGHDKIFRRYFSVTGADLSSGMLNIARVANPGIEYLEGDMRTLRLNRQFDAVAIPDSIDYMVSQYELRQAVQTAALHLKTNGVLLLVAKTKETFQNRNFAYTGEKDGVHVTLFENNFINPVRPHAWEQVFRDAGLHMNKTQLTGIYDKYLLDGGEYPLTVYVGTKDPMFKSRKQEQ